LTLQWLRLANYGVRISEANLLEKSVKRASACGEANDRNLVRLGLRSHGVHPPPPQLHKFPFFWKESFLLFYSVTSITVLWNSQSNIKFLESYNTPSCPRHRSTNSSIGVGRSGRFDHHQIRFAHKSAISLLLISIILRTKLQFTSTITTMALSANAARALEQVKMVSCHISDCPIPTRSID
jgi:hypothetical protein